MKISVVIPVYNEEKHIGACLQSLQKQTTPPDEIIVVNNNSTDASVAIAQKYGVKIVNEKQQGIIYARNRGFDEAQGDIIARTDSDALLPQNWIEKIKSHFQNYAVDAVGGPIVYYDLPFNTPLPAKIFLHLLKHIQKGEPALLGPNMTIKKEMWNKIKNDVCLKDSQVHEDIDLSIHIRRAGGKIISDDTLIVHTTARRIKQHPLSFFIEYPRRLINTFRIHKNVERGT
ncbi:MAG: glycosyltransferase [bacterium]|nr:glycosyltransferase [bacterium]